MAAANDGWIPHPRLPEYGHPLHTFIDPLSLKNGPLPNSTAKTFIRAIGNRQIAADPTFEQFAQLTRTSTEWNYLEIATGHRAPRDDPAGLAKLLLELE